MRCGPALSLIALYRICDNAFIGFTLSSLNIRSYKESNLMDHLEIEQRTT